MTDVAIGAETAGESRILSELSHGETIWLSRPPDAVDEAFQEHDWSGAEVRGEFLAALARAAPVLVGLSIGGARVLGSLNLRWSTVPAPLELRNSYFEESIQLDGATIHQLMLTGSYFPGLRVPWGRVGLLMARRSQCNGKMDFSPCEIGYLGLGGCHVTADDKVAIDANVLTSERSVDINAGAKVTGTVRFIGAHIGGQLNLRNSTFEAPDDRALSVHEATVARGLYLRDATFRGTVNLSGATIGGRIDARDACFSTRRGLAIDMNGCDIKRAVQFDGAHCDGEVRMVTGRVGTYFRAGRSAELLAPSAHAIAEYGKDNPDLQRLTGYGIFVSDSTVGGQFIASDGTTVQGLAIRRSHVGGSVRLDGVKLQSSATTGTALSMAGSKVDGSLVLHQLEGSTGTVDVTHTTVERLDDSLPWRCDSFLLDGFDYRTIANEEPKSVLAARKEWLRSQAAFSAQPYEQLASVYRDAGYPDQARALLWAREVDMREKGRLVWWSKLASITFGATVGHGFGLHRALYWLVPIWLAGVVIFMAGWNAQDIDLAGRDPKEERKECPTGTPCFSPWLLSLDVVVPIVEVGQQSAWVPRRGLAQKWATIEAAAGWALTTATAAGYARKLQRQ